MKKTLENTLWKFINKYCQKNAIDNIWQYPVVKFANAANPLFDELKTLIVNNHHIPSDYLSNARTVVSYFLPFVSRCFAGALTKDGFDRFTCLEQCMKNDAIYSGADVCGKCVVELPCSHGEFVHR